MVLTVPHRGPVLRATLIFLHGLGDTGRGWLEPMRQLVEGVPGLRVLLPDAPLQAVTLNGGLRMPAWYDIVDLHEEANHDLAGMHRSRLVIDGLLRDAGGVKDAIDDDARHVWLVGGFSQGAVVGLLTALQNPRVRAAVCLSGYLPPGSESLRFVPRRDQIGRLQLWLAHGTADDVVRFTWGQKSHEELLKHLPPGQVAATFKAYPGLGHSCSNRELADLIVFVKDLLNSPTMAIGRGEL
jgi:predicted esterase